MAGLDPAIHDFPSTLQARTWMPGTSPGMTSSWGRWFEILPDRRRVLDPAIAPERVQPARDLQLRSFADIALVDFAVIADMADDAGGPVLAQAEVFAVGALGADQPHHVGLLRLQRLVDILRGDAKLLGVDHRVKRPLHQHHPVVVALAH